MEGVGRVRRAGRVRRDLRRRAQRPAGARPPLRQRGDRQGLMRGTGAHNGKPAVIFAIQKQPGANTLELTERLDRVRRACSGPAPGHDASRRRSSGRPISSSAPIDNCSAALREGLILVVAIVLRLPGLAARHGRTLVAMPLSLVVAVLVLQAFGATINTMTLGGLAIALGALVDDAIIVVENIVRRLQAECRPRQRRARPTHRGRARRDPRDPGLDRLRDADHHAGVPAGVPALRRRGAAAAAARPRLCRCAGRLAHRRTDGHAGAVPSVPASGARGA